MKEFNTSCIRCVGGEKVCSYCSEKLVRHGRTASGKIRYRCKSCRRTQVENYTYNAYQKETNNQIITLTKEGLGIRSTARVLRISTTTLLKRLLLIASNIPQPPVAIGKIYEVDEMRIFIRRKTRRYWIVYALERESRQVANFAVGTRSNKTLNSVLQTLRYASAKAVYTDGLRNYRYLLSRSVHRVTLCGTNRIERNNLTLRTHLKRLTRKTICYSRSVLLLSAVLRIYFWV